MKQRKHDLEEQRKSRGDLTDGLDLHNGIPMPSHMMQPGRDGYRTPTIHDYEHVEPESGEKTNPPDGGCTPTPQSAASQARQSDKNISWERLQWNERLKHYTWSFFTMTMATGGIANVLYTGSWISTSSLLSPRLTGVCQQYRFGSEVFTQSASYSSCSISFSLSST